MALWAVYEPVVQNRMGYECLIVARSVVSSRGLPSKVQQIEESPDQNCER